MNSFYSEENLRMLVNISKKYLDDKFSHTINDDRALKKLAFEVMSDVEEECKGKKVTLDRKNVAVLNSIKEVYIQKYKLSTNSTNSVKKPNMQSLARDKEIFGNRPVVSSSIVPDIDPYQKKVNIPNEMSRIIEDRDVEAFGPPLPKPDITRIAPQTKDDAEDNEAFMKKLKDLENQRKELDISDIERRNEQDVETHEMLATSKHDPKTLFMNSINSNSPKENLNLNNPDQSTRKELIINPKTTQRRILDKYIGISSQDRVWWNDDTPYRYQYSVSLLTRYRNIDALTIGKVIIPDDIIQLSDPSKQNFNYDFALGVPYLILKIEEFNDVYDGTNDVIRKAFCKLIFSKSYRGQNGRGYVIMKPEQMEKKYFYPAPLGLLNRLSISILKPNGKLVNYSKDSYKILSITYDVSKPNYYKITLDSYYDKNEFFTGDSVLFKDFIMTQATLLQGNYDIQTFNTYINALEGYDILEMGLPNVFGFYNYFYIQAIGTFSSSIGEFTPSTQLITCLNNYNSAISGSIINGSILNMSLQNSISMKIDMIVDDAKILDTQSTFNF